MDVETHFKRQRLDESGASCAPASVARDNFALAAFPRANDVINFLVRSPFSDTLSAPVRPWFTHQIFPDEQLRLTATQFPPGSFVNVVVDAQTLAFDVEVHLTSDIPATDQQAVLEYLKEHMRPLALPKDTDDAQFRIVGPDAHRQPTEAAKRAEDGACAAIGELIATNQGPAEDLSAFEVRLATHQSDAAASALLARLEALAMWFIETASSVDFTEAKWELLVAYEVGRSTTTTPPQRSVAGYLTLYTFHNPFLGSKIRICQALVLPHHLQRGLGRLLLRAAYDLALARAHVVEITVEDPCAAFANLRDQIDFALLAERRPDATAASVDAVAKALKLIPAQACFVVDARDFFRLLTRLLTAAPAAADDAATVDAARAMLRRRTRETLSDTDRALLEDALDAVDAGGFKALRLQAKRHLLRFDADGLRDLPKPDMQRALSELFDDRLDRFLRLTAAAQRLQLLPP